MAEAVMDTARETSDSEAVLRVYEIGYHVSPSAKEDEVERVVSEIRGMIETAGGSFIAEGAPSLTRLAYTISGKENGRRVEYDRGYFGWLKFEAPSEAAAGLMAALERHEALLRSVLFQTVREETRARFKTPTLREVKRTDTIRSAPRTAEESPAVPVSEADLDKALEDITAE